MKATERVPTRRRNSLSLDPSRLHALMSNQRNASSSSSSSALRDQSIRVLSFKDSPSSVTSTLARQKQPAKSPTSSSSSKASSALAELKEPASVPMPPRRATSAHPPQPQALAQAVTSPRKVSFDSSLPADREGEEHHHQSGHTTKLSNSRSPPATATSSPRRHTRNNSKDKGDGSDEELDAEGRFRSVDEEDSDEYDTLSTFSQESVPLSVITEGDEVSSVVSSVYDVAISAARLRQMQKLRSLAARANNLPPQPSVTVNALSPATTRFAKPTTVTPSSSTSSFSSFSPSHARDHDDAEQAEHEAFISSLSLSRLSSASSFSSSSSSLPPSRIPRYRRNSLPSFADRSLLLTHQWLASLEAGLDIHSSSSASSSSSSTSSSSSSASTMKPSLSQGSTPLAQAPRTLQNQSQLSHAQVPAHLASVLGGETKLKHKPKAAAPAPATVHAPPRASPPQTLRAAHGHAAGDSYSQMYSKR